MARTLDPDARRRLLALARDLDNVVEACRRLGVSRSVFYRIRARVEHEGAGAYEPRVRRRPRMPNETPAALAASILEWTYRFPTYGYRRLAAQAVASGAAVTPGAVRAVWERQAISSRDARLHWFVREARRRGAPVPARYRFRVGDPEGSP